MKKSSKNANNGTVTVVIGKVPKVIKVSDNEVFMKELIRRYEESQVFGVGGSTMNKFRELAKSEIAKYESVNPSTAKEKFSLLIDIFKVNFEETPYLYRAIEWITSGEVNSSAEISLDTLCDHLHLEKAQNSYTELENEFRSFPWHQYCNTWNLRVGIIRFCKIIYAIAK